MLTNQFVSHTSRDIFTIPTRWFALVSVVVLQDIWMRLRSVGTVTLT
jgi:hypothetical protein